MKKIWKNIENYESLYQISNFGEIKSLKNNKILTPIISKGYNIINLFKDNKMKTFYIRHLVAKHFIGDRPKNHIISNKNFIKTDDNYENLYYVTIKEQKNILSKNGKLSKISNNEIFNIKKMLCMNENPVIIAKKYNITVKTVHNIKQNKTGHHIAWPEIEKNFYKKPILKGESLNKKLKNEDVLNIKKALQNKIKGSVLAKQYNVNESIISRIKSGEIWSHITI